MSIKMDFQKDYDYLFKMVMIGNSAVGKSSLHLKFTKNIFSENFLPTIGADFAQQTMQVEGKTIKLQLWDTAGQERFKWITSSYYAGAHGIAIVYDITDRASFKNLQTWLDQVEKFTLEKVSIILIGNKCDLENQRQVSYDEGKAFADELGIKFIETSAKECINVSEIFQSMTTEIMRAQKFKSSSTCDEDEEDYQFKQRKIRVKKIDPNKKKTGFLQLLKKCFGI